MEMTMGGATKLLSQSGSITPLSLSPISNTMGGASKPISSSLPNFTTVFITKLFYISSDFKSICRECFNLSRHLSIYTYVSLIIL